MRLESGNNYKISELFCGDNDKIIIPDLQRDYCWGNPDNNLVKGFVEGLLEMNYEQPITMGLIYGYYDKFTDCHLHLCDGQQRLTTIFLILGVLNRKLGFKKFNHLLMSSFELDCDDKEPYLQYAIRESSLYFLSDLTVNYFLNNSIDSVEKIESQPWFLNEFSVDPTVSSILNAIKTIEECLNNKSENKLKALGGFIVSKLEFLFYDMENRANGEETFVIINTTGEPLSATQNLKPLVISQNLNYSRKTIEPDGSPSTKNAAQDWEEMETWFWRNRNKNKQETGHPHTADEGMDCFLNVVRFLHCKTEEESYKTVESEEKFPYKEITFKEIYDDFTVYKQLYEMDFSERLDKNIRYPLKQKYYQQDRLYAILPTMRYCLRFYDAEDEDVKRIYHIFSNMARYRYVYRSENDGILYSPVHRAIEMIDKMETKEIASLANILANIENGEETNKIEFAELYKNSPEECKEVELLMAIAENHYVFKGRVSVIVDWSKRDKDSFKKYYQKFVEYWGNDANTNLDTLRRALVTQEMVNYPLRKDDSYTFGNESTWLEIIKNNTDKIRDFLDDTRTLQKMIDNYEQSKKWAEFVHRDYLLDYCEEIRRGYSDGWRLIKKTNRQRYISVNCYHLVKYLVNESRYEGWSIWDCGYCHSCIVENYNRNIKFFIRNQDDKWVIQLSKRDNVDVENSLKPYIDDKWSFNGYRYEKTIDFNAENYYEYPNVVNELNAVINKIEQN